MKIKETFLCPSCAGTGLSDIKSEDPDIVIFCTTCSGLGEVYEKSK